MGMNVLFMEGLKILIADDHTIMRDSAALVLKKAFSIAKIGLAENGQVLVNKVTDDDWNLVISDMSMPVMSGLEALQLIKKLKPDLPVLIISINSGEKFALRARNAGASGYLPKNRLHTELIDVVQKLLAGKKYFSGMLKNDNDP